MLAEENFAFSGIIFFVGVVIWSFVICQNRKHTVKIRHYNINIYIYIYSEQITAFPKLKMTKMTLTKWPQWNTVHFPMLAYQDTEGPSVLRGVPPSREGVAALCKAIGLSCRLYYLAICGTQKEPSLLCLLFVLWTVLKFMLSSTFCQNCLEVRDFFRIFVPKCLTK